MKVVCQNVSGQLYSEKRLEDFVPYAERFYSHRPRMVKFHHRDGITLLIFTSLRFRLMGKGENHMKVLHEILKRLPWSVTYGSIHLNSMTVTHQLPHPVNLYRLNRDHFRVEHEIFPAAEWIHDSNEHFNVFHSGCVVITGVKCLHKTETILLPRLVHDIQHAFCK